MKMSENWAISIGINQYDNLQSLNFAKRDAEAMAAWFREEAKFDQVFLFTEDSPAINTTSPPIPTQPTFGGLRGFLRRQFEQPLLKPGDNLWFFFAGHGIRHADKDYLMLADSDHGDIEHTAISVEYITERLRRSRADNVVLLLDACREESSRSGLGIGEEKHQGVITFYSCIVSAILLNVVKQLPFLVVPAQPTQTPTITNYPVYPTSATSNHHGFPAFLTTHQ